MSKVNKRLVVAIDHESFRKAFTKETKEVLPSDGIRNIVDEFYSERGLSRSNAAIRLASLFGQMQAQGNLKGCIELYNRISWRGWKNG